VYKLPVPVLIVGNVVVGGTGKTPTCIALIQYLQARGYSPGLVSRGYGRQDKTPYEVFTHDRPDRVGDETLLIKQKTDVPVFVANSRVKAASLLLNKYPRVNIIVSDDGLQHYALGRDIEVILLDGREQNQPSHRTRLLPAGWLREPWPRQPIFFAPSLLLRSPKRSLIIEGLDLQQEYVAVTGIAKPNVFFAALRAHGVRLQRTLALPDHDRFRPEGPLALWLKTLPSDIKILCTEKDIVKIRCTYSHLQERLYPIPMQVYLPKIFLKGIDKTLQCIA
jgi:tetraacyldisaccharide 4'-kinase